MAWSVHENINIWQREADSPDSFYEIEGGPLEWCVLVYTCVYLCIPYTVYPCIPFITNTEPFQVRATHDSRQARPAHVVPVPAPLPPVHPTKQPPTKQPRTQLEGDRDNSRDKETPLRLLLSAFEKNKDIKDTGSSGT